MKSKQIIFGSAEAQKIQEADRLRRKREAEYINFAEGIDEKKLSLWRVREAIEDLEEEIALLKEEEFELKNEIEQGEKGRNILIGEGLLFVVPDCQMSFEEMI